MDSLELTNFLLIILICLISLLGFKVEKILDLKIEGKLIKL